MTADRLAELNEAKNQVAYAEETVRLSRQSAQMDAELTERHSKAVHDAQQLIAEDQRQQRKSLGELAVARAANKAFEDGIRADNPDSPLITAKAIADRDAATVRAHQTAQKGLNDRKAVLRDQLTIAKTAFDQEKSLYNEREKMLNTYHKSFGMSDADYYAAEKVARE